MSHPRDLDTPLRWFPKAKQFSLEELFQSPENLSSPTKHTSMTSPLITGKSLSSPPKELFLAKEQHMLQLWLDKCKWLFMVVLLQDLKICLGMNCIYLTSENSLTGKSSIPVKTKESLPDKGMDIQ